MHEWAASTVCSTGRAFSGIRPASLPYGSGSDCCASPPFFFSDDQFRKISHPAENWKVQGIRWLSLMA